MKAYESLKELPMSKEKEPMVDRVTKLITIFREAGNILDKLNMSMKERIQMAGLKQKIRGPGHESAVLASPTSLYIPSSSPGTRTLRILPQGSRRQAPTWPPRSR